MRALGRIEGRLEGIENTQQTHGVTLTSMDTRLRTVETKAAVNGAVSGGLIATGVVIIKELVTHGVGKITGA